MTEDERRELQKVLDTLYAVAKHFFHEANMNAALHMAANVRPAPLHAATDTAIGTAVTYTPVPANTNGTAVDFIVPLDDDGIFEAWVAASLAPTSNFEAYVLGYWI